MLSCVSLYRCRHLDSELPETVTCGGRCPEFPACLPPPPDLIGTLLRARASEESRTAVDDALHQVHAAILEGLRRE
jgi:hypothetical protein